METRQADTITPHLPTPHTAGQTVVMSRTDVEAIVDARLADHLHQIDEERRRSVREIRDANIRSKVVTMGAGAALGLGLGIGSTLLVQKIKRRSMAK